MDDEDVDDEGWRRDRVGSALRGQNPTVLRRLDAGFAVIGDTQFLPGYSVLLVDEPGVGRLSELPRARRLAFLADMDRLSEAVERACGRLDPAFRRVNLEILGNTDPFLHAHIWGLSFGSRLGRRVWHAHLRRCRQSPTLRVDSLLRLAAARTTPRSPAAARHRNPKPA
ncbi:hypothetical protein ACWD4G_12425 [Streptomyces sp. NPDC002643]